MPARSPVRNMRTPGRSPGTSTARQCMFTCTRGAKTEQYVISMKLRKKVEMLFAHLKRILGLGRLRLRGPCGANDEFLLAATAQNLRKLAKLLPAPQQTRSARQERHARHVQLLIFRARERVFFHGTGLFC
ncbi:transposase [Primorskyibacter sp. 2E233]|uniref:transposase n=1 Tax=Primorskyibacter sp. 2E233 TaxID=3413431 RepID=UPI003BF2193F